MKCDNCSNKEVVYTGEFKLCKDCARLLDKHTKAKDIVRDTFRSLRRLYER